MKQAAESNSNIFPLSFTATRFESFLTEHATWIRKLLLHSDAGFFLCLMKAIHVLK